MVVVTAWVVVVAAWVVIVAAWVVVVAAWVVVVTAWTVVVVTAWTVVATGVTPGASEKAGPASDAAGTVPKNYLVYLILKQESIFSNLGIVLEFTSHSLSFRLLVTHVHLSISCRRRWLV